MIKCLLFLLFCAAAVQGDDAQCESDQLVCGERKGNCVRIGYVCDGDNDCGDNTDEDDTLCEAWKIHYSRCDRGHALCDLDNDGTKECVPFTQFCKLQQCREGEVDSRICVLVNNMELQPLHTVHVPESWNYHELVLENFKHTEHDEEHMVEHMKHTIQSEDPNCPKFFTKVGSHCLSIFYFGNLTWGESNAFCKSFEKAQLFVPHSYDEFVTVNQHLRDNHITSDFWVGGYHTSKDGWKWLDSTVELHTHTPQWALRHNSHCEPRSYLDEEHNSTVVVNNDHCYHIVQAPGKHLHGECVAITYDKFFLLSDEDCRVTKAPLCQYIG